MKLLKRAHGYIFITVGMVLTVFSLCQAVELDPADYVDPRIGNIAPFLVPTYPTYQLPNQMLRMYPIRNIPANHMA